MKRTRLVQRLNPPWEVGVKKGVDNPFNFGGGLRNGGLSKVAMDLLRPIFEFDYMGAAEYEFGAVPEALVVIKEAAAEGRLVPFTLKGLKKPVYGLAPAEIVDEAQAVIRELAKKNHDFRLKEPSLLREALDPNRDPEWPIKAKGWLELDNGFFFTVDKAMFEKLAALMGVKLS